ncbi:type IV toxin-antitoxin system AbiEi family antitoxin domain-containing protein [Agromyces agglutinans]|uniref:type IV toxin-antitoxin system AbiEi family antitoxin domain-containing protein n=1 Tax=Agromyces agglutinans TaxID=2662258 RepID=UPI0035E42A8D
MITESHLIHRACSDLGGVARACDLAAYGVPRRAFERAVRDGVLLRLRPGIYAVPETSRPIVEAVRHGGVIGCVTVAQAEGLWVLAEHPGIHVSMRPNGRARPHADCACVVHWNARSRHEVSVPLAEALVQIFGCLGPEQFFVCLESAMRRRAIDRRGLAGIRRAVPAPARRLVDFARWDADSGLESLLRLRLRELGIELSAQVDVPGVGRVDFVLGDRLILEVDGRDGHDGPSNRHKDRVRDVVAAAHGFDTLRFDYALVVHEWPLVRDAILAKIDRGLHLAPARPSRAR